MSFHLQDQQGKEKSKGQFNIEILPCTHLYCISCCVPGTWETKVKTQGPWARASYS